MVKLRFTRLLWAHKECAVTDGINAMAQHRCACRCELVCLRLERGLGNEGERHGLARSQHQSLRPPTFRTLRRADLERQVREVQSVSVVCWQQLLPEREKKNLQEPHCLASTQRFSIVLMRPYLAMQPALVVSRQQLFSFRDIKNNIVVTCLRVRLTNTTGETRDTVRVRQRLAADPASRAVEC